MIPYGRQDVTEADIDAVVAVMRSDFLTQGAAVPRFESAVASLVGAEHAIAVNSATSALHVACLALDLGPGDILWTVPNTFVASANCALYCGASVDFVDIDPQTWNLSTAALERKLAEGAKAGRLPKIVVPVHFAGQPTDQELIWNLSQQYGFKVIEDASHSVGAARHDEAVGSCRWSHVTVFSFHPVKIITSAEGGMAMTRQGELAERMAMLRSHGVTRDPARLGCADPPPWYYEQQMLGFNYRMTDVHAALGASQLTRLGEYVERRNALARRYDAALRDLPLQLPTVRSENRSAFHLYAVHLDRSRGTDYHRKVFVELRKRGIGVNLHYMPVHLQPYYRKLGFRRGQYPQAEIHGESAMTLPLYATLEEGQQDHAISALREVLLDA
jgi:UDP-4-amino-4,6-dideoxy-N-acetyl-beta-L-altrosamine transaminase